MFKSILMNEIKDFSSLNIVDIRESYEHAMGVIPKALLLPLSNLDKLTESLDKEKEYYIICQSGSRSQMACQLLSGMGYKLVNVMGGMGAYRGALE